MISRSIVRANATEITEMMMMMISSSLSPDLIILCVTSSLQELFPTSLLTRHEYSPDIYKANQYNWSFTLPEITIDPVNVKQQ